jgi:hypothetical protein
MADFPVGIVHVVIGRAQVVVGGGVIGIEFDLGERELTATA